MIGLDFIYRPDGQLLNRYVEKIKRELNPDLRVIEGRLREHLSWCVDQVPMYRNCYSGSGSSFDWLRQFPVFDKKEYRVPVDYVRSRASFKGERIDGTSGTSGVSFKFLTTENERAVRKAYELVANSLIGLGPADRSVVVWGGHEASSLVPKMKVWLFDKIASRRLVVVSGSDGRSLLAAKREILKNSGCVLVTYPSMLRGLIEELGLYDELKKCKSIILTGEAIPESFFETYSGCKLANRYGSREFGAIGVGNGMELGYFSGRFVLESDPDAGLLITDMSKRCMPMLRYPIGDFPANNIELNDPDRLLSFGDHCLPSMGSITGRVFDALKGKSGKVYVGTFWTIYLKKLGLEKFRLIEVRPGCVCLKYVGQIQEHSLLEMLDATVKSDFNWSAEKVSEIPELTNAKQKIVERLNV